jgi:hypothetical protein
LYWATDGSLARGKQVMSRWGTASGTSRNGYGKAA